MIFDLQLFNRLRGWLNSRGMWSFGIRSNPWFKDCVLSCWRQTALMLDVAPQTRMGVCFPVLGGENRKGSGCDLVTGVSGWSASPGNGEGGPAWSCSLSWTLELKGRDTFEAFSSNDVLVFWDPRVIVVIPKCFDGRRRRRGFGRRVFT